MSISRQTVAAAAPVLADGLAPRTAASTDSKSTDSEQALCATIERLVETLGRPIEGLPRYAPPEIDSHGNIILRRLNPRRPTSPLRPPPQDGWALDRTSA